MSMKETGGSSRGGLAPSVSTIWSSNIGLERNMRTPMPCPGDDASSVNAWVTMEKPGSSEAWTEPTPETLRQAGVPRLGWGRGN